MLGAQVDDLESRPPQKIVDFFAATEFVFNRPVEASDFMKVFELLGADTDGE